MTAAPEATPVPHPDWRIVIGVWVLIASWFVLRAVLALPQTPLYGDSDDVMRLVTATDLLSGQGWQDLIQHRDNAPFGVEMHWSRLIDLPIAGLLALTSPLGVSTANEATAIIWPLLLMLPLLFLSSTLILRLVPMAGQITAVALPLVTLAILIEFMPGRLDHHNVQVLLLLVVLLSLLAGRDRRWGGVVAGLTIATSLAIGLEALPVSIIASACFALLWAAEPQRYRRTLVGFAVSLAVGSAGHYLLATTPAHYGQIACDAFSVVHLLAIGLAGIAMLAAASLTDLLARPWQRLALLAAVGGLALAVVQLLFPNCLFNPYGTIDPRLLETYFPTITEAQSLWTRLQKAPGTGVGFALPILAALPLTVWIAWHAKGDRRTDWLIMVALLTASTLVMVMQMRGARIAAPLALPAAAWLIVGARNAYSMRPNPMNGAQMAGAWLLAAGFVQLGIVNAIVKPSTTQATETGQLPVQADVRLPAVYKTLASLPAGNVVAPFPVHVYVLLNTPHSVVSAGFHRNATGIRDTAEFLTSADPEAAARIVKDRQLDYVVTYRGAPGYETIPLYPWLRLISPPDDPLEIYQVESSSARRFHLQYGAIRRDYAHPLPRRQIGPGDAPDRVAE